MMLPYYVSIYFNTASFSFVFPSSEKKQGWEKVLALTLLSDNNIKAENLRVSMRHPPTMAR